MKTAAEGTARLVAGGLTQRPLPWGTAIRKRREKNSKTYRQPLKKEKRKIKSVNKFAHNNHFEKDHEAEKKSTRLEKVKRT